jgi:amidase
MDDLAFLSGLELGALLRERQVTSAELVEAALRRIEMLDPELGAFTYVDGDRALARAREIEPDDRRAFAGVPIAVKANTPVQGMVMDFGSRLLDGYRADHDAYLVRRLHEEGFVIVGTTKLPELGILPSTEPVHGGPTRNPFDLGHSAGGSSGGSAAAVAAGMLPLAHGNDGGGSIRIPAACCGLLGLKPTRGRVSRGPDQGDSFLVVDGALTRTVLDTAAALDVMAGYEVGDATWVPRPAEPYVKAFRREPGQLRVAVTTSNPLGHPLDPENEAAVREAAALLESFGHHVEEVDAALPGPESLELFLTVYAGNIGLGAAYAQLLAGREPGPDDFEPLTRAFVQRATETSSVQLLAAQAMLQALARGVVALWADCDVMLVPALAQRPVPLGVVHGSVDPPMEGFERATAFAPYAGLFNITGQPAVSIPMGLGSDGLPTAVQLVGPPLGEETLLQIAFQVEQARPWAHLRPTPAPRSSAAA